MAALACALGIIFFAIGHALGFPFWQNFPSINPFVPQSELALQAAGSDAGFTITVQFAVCEPALEFTVTNAVYVPAAG